MLAEDHDKVSGRKARVDHNRCADHDGSKEWAVFMYTYYLGRWYYDGYAAHSTKEEAEVVAENYRRSGK